LRRRHDRLSHFRAAGALRHLAPHPELFSAVAIQAEADRGRPQMSPLLAVDKLEVVYHRTITAVQGINLTVNAQRSVAILGPKGAGKPTTLRAISGFLGIDDARVTEGAITFKGQRIEHRPPHVIARSGMVLVPERDKVFPNLTVADNLSAAIGLGRAD